MRRLMTMIVAAASLTLASCATLGARSTFDEQAVLGVELSYQAAGLSAVTARNAGLISEQKWDCVKRLDNVAYTFVKKTRVAYDNRDPVSQAVAGTEAVAAVRRLVAREGCG